MKSRKILGIMLMLMLVGPAWSVMFASAQPTTLSVFSTGTAQETITMNGGTHASLGFDLERNTTIQDAFFFLSPDSGTTQSPGNLWLDLDQNGINEWEFNQSNYGGFGVQTMFADGNNSTSTIISPNSVVQMSTNSSDFLLPYGAALSDARVTVEFEPTFSGGFYQMGPVIDVAIGDIENNSISDAVILSSSNATTGVGTAFSVMGHDNTTGITNTSWTPTCTNATRIMVDDLNGDSFQDVVTYAPTDNVLCTHLYNGTSGSFSAQANFTLPSTVIDLDIGDTADDGYADLITIRSGGVVDIAEYNSKSGGYASVSSLTIYQQSGGTTTATLSAMYLARFNGELNPYKLVVVDNTGQCIQIEYFQSTSIYAELANRFSGLGTDSIYGDIDSDGDLDFIATRGAGHRSIENRITSWDSDNHQGLLDLTNASIIDHNYDMDSSLFLPQVAVGDGNPATIEGNFTTYNFDTTGNNQGRVLFNTEEVIEPWTMPKSIDFGDFDGDGIREHVIVAGEGSQHGVFIGGWHEIGYDVDHNSVMDYTASGYAGNGSNGLPPLEILDPVNNLSSDLGMMSYSWDWTVDGYGIQMSPVNFSLGSLGNGTFHFSELNITYNADFQVNFNPHPVGNLTNVLNQQMTGGSGTLFVPLVFSSTQNGSFLISNPTVTYIQGAPNIALPPTPVLQVAHLNSTVAEIIWQNQSDFGDDLLEFIVYRVRANQSLDLMNIYSNSMLNGTMDSDFLPGETYTYYVRSIHAFGVTSNLSAPLSIYIPYPPPQSYIPNITAGDHPGDSGGVLDVSWSSGHASITHHNVYVSSTNFTSIAELNASIVVPSSVLMANISVDDEGQPLTDGIAYYVTVVGVDQYGNASQQVIANGPFYTRNDTVLVTTLDVSYVGFTEDTAISQVLLKEDGSLHVTAHLHHDGVAVEGAELSLNILGENDNYTLFETTNDSGVAVFTVADLSTLGPIEALGSMSLSVAYAGSQGGVIDRPLTPAYNQTDAFGTVAVNFTTVEPISLTEGGSFTTTLLVDAQNADQQNLLANMLVGWDVKSEDGSDVFNGTGTVQGNEMVLSGVGSYGGTLYIQLDPSMPYYYTPGMSLTLLFEDAPAVDQNQNNSSTTNNTTTFPAVILPGTVDCGTATYSWSDNGTDESIICVITNPNPFGVQVGFDWKSIPSTLPPISFETFNNPDSMPANGILEVEFTPVRNGPSDGLFPGMQGVGYVLQLTCLDDETSRCANMITPSASSEGEIQWTLAEKPLNATDNTGSTNSGEDGSSSSMTPVLVGIGIVLFVAAAIGGAIFMRSRFEDDFDDEDDEDYYAEAMDESDARSEKKRFNLAESKSLDSLKAEGKELHEDAPEGLESPMLGSSADAFQFGATAEDAIPEVNAEEDDAQDSEEEWAEEAEEDDGISVDEDGTEWWEDEEGVWWYREEGWEDWAVWED